MKILNIHLFIKIIFKTICIKMRILEDILWPVIRNGMEMSIYFICNRKENSSNIYFKNKTYFHRPKIFPNFHLLLLLIDFYYFLIFFMCSKFIPHSPGSIFAHYYTVQQLISWTYFNIRWHWFPDYLYSSNIPRKHHINS